MVTHVVIMALGNENVTIAAAVVVAIAVVVEVIITEAAI
jgi:hypothetical protein